MSIRVRLLSVFFLLILIFLVDFFVNQELSREVIRNSSYLSNSEAVIRNSNMLHKHMIDMQGSFRGYLLTDQEVFLEPYKRGEQAVMPLFAEQKSLISSKRQQERIDSIMRLHLTWVDYSKALIGAKKDTLPDAGNKYRELFEQKVRKEEGKKINDAIRILFAEFDEAEYITRQGRRFTLEKSIERTRNITLALALLSVVFAVVCSILIIRGISRRISDMVKLARDISAGEFKQIRDDHKDELKHLSDSLNVMSDVLSRNFRELNRKNTELDQFAYIVSHDLKAPLRGISNLLKWTEEDYGPEISENVKKNIDLMQGRTIRLENMINGLLEYARIGRVKAKQESVDVKALLLDLKEILVPPGYAFTLKSEMPVLLTEKLRLEQVFSNLINNAVKHGNREAGLIEISCRPLAGEYEFSVRDNGPGIAPEYHTKIFTIFQTLKERDAFESTGVGLAIVKKIIDDRHGQVRVESTPPNGSTFIFTWPDGPQKGESKQTELSPKD